MSVGCLEKKNNLLEFDQQELRTYIAALGEKPFRASQLMHWLYKGGETDIMRMHNIKRSCQQVLSEHAEVRLPEVQSVSVDPDGTRKWMLQLDGGDIISCVYIPEPKRRTLCISTQAGCALNCSFCATARGGFSRNLTTAEIIGQLYLADLLLREAQQDPISNVVLMGMGEPLANFDAVVKALRLMVDDHAYGLSKRRVTLSTSGIVPAMYRLYDAIDVSLAVSLHAPNNHLRDQLVPINRKYPLAELMQACLAYTKIQRKAQVTFEYVMLDGVNDLPEHARELVKLVRDIPSKINLIPFNTFDSAGYRRSSDLAIQRFSEILLKSGLFVTVRKTRGQKIGAACGQLTGVLQGRIKRAFRTPAQGVNVI